MDYKQKYLKYKQKYLELKQQIGGIPLRSKFSETDFIKAKLDYAVNHYENLLKFLEDNKLLDEITILKYDFQTQSLKPKDYVGKRNEFYILEGECNNYLYAIPDDIAIKVPNKTCLYTYANILLNTKPNSSDEIGLFTEKYYTDRYKFNIDPDTIKKTTIGKTINYGTITSVEINPQFKIQSKIDTDYNELVSTTVSTIPQKYQITDCRDPTGYYGVIRYKNPSENINMLGHANIHKGTEKIQIQKVGSIDTFREITKEDRQHIYLDESCKKQFQIK